MPTITRTYLPVAEASYEAARAEFIASLTAQIGQPTGYQGHRRTTWSDIAADVASELDAYERDDQAEFPTIRAFLETWGPAMTVAALAEAMARYQLGLKPGVAA